jgi:hypothetical protein
LDTDPVPYLFQPEFEENELIQDVQRGMMKWLTIWFG